MSIKSGTPCFLSRRGHNNFIYPIFDEAGLTYFTEDVQEYEMKTWICGNSNLRAVVVSANQLHSLVCTTSTKTVVWIDIEKTTLK